MRRLIALTDASPAVAVASRWVPALLFVLGCQSASAQVMGDAWREFQQARHEGRATTIVGVDNDTLLFNHQDKFYTSGVRLTRQFALPAGAAAGASQVSYGWRIGQDLYTASDIKLLPQRVGPPDHPYAGWLYGGVFREAVELDGSHQRFGFDLGCLGPCAGGRGTQTALHHLIHQPQPQSWSRQVRNELGAVLYADVAPVRWQFGRHVDLAPSAQGRFGNVFTDVAGSLLLRAGQLEPGPLVASLQAFTRVQARAVGYNASLQGGYFSRDNPHVVTPRRLVGEVEAGVRWMYRNYALSAAFVRIGNENADLSNAIGAQNLARLQLAITP